MLRFSQVDDGATALLTCMHYIVSLSSTVPYTESTDG